MRKIVINRWGPVTIYLLHLLRILLVFTRTGNGVQIHFMRGLNCHFRDIFLRELISNANDALEKLRLMSLTNKEVLEGAEELNITIKAVKDEDGSGGRLIITG
jgi:hypothetical protein